MRVIVFLFFMGRVHMLMGTMFPGMVVIMHMGIPHVLMGVRMLMLVLMGVGVLMLVGVHHISVTVLMVVLVGVFVGMQVLVFVFTFHGESLPGYSSEPCQGFLSGGGPGAATLP